MGTEAIGCVLGQQCAPVIAGVKPSNLLIVEKGNQSGLTHVLRGTGLSRYLLYTSAEKDYWFLFEADGLLGLLHDAQKAQYLRDCGYFTEDPNAVLAKLAERFKRYKQDDSEFPHEIGILLGYPLRDVKGFIENGGQNFKLSGYWKVYGDVNYAGQIFGLYEHVKKAVLDLCAQGMCISDIRNRLLTAGDSAFIVG
ncbi:MAG: DUF3793 family protein [Lachnospiraceae bacterium]|nr:DUF3793 family protein [Lachnospiraceae bacterium]